MLKQKKIFKFIFRRNFRINPQNYNSQNFQQEQLKPNQEKQPLKSTENKETYKIFETAKIEAKSNPIRTLLSIIALIVAIIAFIYRIISKEQPWSPTDSIPLISFEYKSQKMPKEYLPRKKIEQSIDELLNRSKLIIVYGPKLSGKTTTINKVLEGRKGVISVSYQKETNLIKELARILKIPIDEISLSTIETVFREFKDKYGSYPIVSVDINGEYDFSMEQWVRDGRHLTEDGKGVCDCIIQFSYEDAALAGLVERTRSNYIKFGDLSKEEAINYLKTFNQAEPEKILEEIKTTRIGVLDKVVQGKKDQYLHEREVDMEFVFNNQKYIEILRQIYEGKLKKVVNIMEKLGIEETQEKEFFQHPLFTKKVLVVDLQDFTVSFDSEFVKDKIKKLK